MKAGLWQILIVLGLVGFFFGPFILRVVRAVSGNGEDSVKKLRKAESGSFKCPKCGKELQAKDKFCSGCGYDVNAIDV